MFFQTHNQTDMDTDRQRWIRRETEHVEREKQPCTWRKTDVWTQTLTDAERQTDRQMDKNKQTGRQTKRQRHRRIGARTDMRTERRTL